MDDGQIHEPEQDSAQNAVLLPASILIAAILISGAVLYSGKRTVAPGQAADISGAAQIPAASGDVQKIFDRDVILGNPNATVTLIEYGDYQCPVCGSFFKDVEGSLRDDYIKTNKVRMIFRNFAFLGPESTAAAEAAECAKDQNKFWAYHDAIYAVEIEDQAKNHGRSENNGNLTRDLFVKLAGDAELDVKVFAGCVDSNRYAKKIEADVSGAQAFGVDATPTTFINGAMLKGLYPYAQYAAAIDSFLKVK